MFTYLGTLAADYSTKKRKHVRCKAWLKGGLGKTNGDPALWTADLDAICTML